MSHVRMQAVARRWAGWGTRVALLALGVCAAPAQAQASYAWRSVVTGGGGGFIPGIIFNTSEPDLVYVRTDIGGAYRWNPSTNRWIPLQDWISFDDWNLMGVDSLATDAVEPNRLYILAGTYTNSWTSQNGAILRSTDRGDSFQRTNLPFKSGGNMPGRNMGERLAIDPNQHAILYLGARSGNGLWKSTDFGVTWAKVANFPDSGPFVEDPNDPNGYLTDPVGVVWVSFDPATASLGNPTRTIYVGVAQNGSGKPNVFRSTDAGATWAAIPGEPICTQSGSIVTCTGGATWDRTRLGNGGTLDWNTGGYLPHHGKVASNGTLYITYNNWEGPYNGSVGDVWKFEPATAVWTKISPVPGSDAANDYFGYGGLAVDANNPNVIMVSALNSWWPDTIFFRSINAGATWTRVWDWIGFPIRSFRYTQDITAAPWLNFGVQVDPDPALRSPKLGWMVGSLEIDPFNSNLLLYGTGATLYGADNLGAWDVGGQIAVKVMSPGIEETAVLDLISPPSGANLYSALGDVAGFRHDNLGASPAQMFTSPTLGSNTSLDYAERSASFIVRSGNTDKSQSPNAQKNRVGFSFDSGANWFQASSEPGGLSPNKLDGGTVAAAADATRVVWSPRGPGSAVFVTTNNGSSWTTATGIPAEARVGSDRVNAMKFYGSANGAFYVSTNGGVSFSVTGATGLPPAGAPVRFKAVPGIEGDLWLAGGSSDSGVYGLWHSTNSGASFTRLANVDEADNIGFGLHAPGQTYVALYSSAQIAGVRGIFRSDDAGASWVRVNDDQHQYGSTGNAITGDLRIYGRVYVSTNGRGIAYGDPGTATPDFSLSANPNSLTVNRGASGTSAVTVARVGGFSGSVAFSVSGLPSGVTGVFNPTSTTGTSSTLTLTASATATLGPATVTVTGTSGSTTRTAAIGLTIAAPPVPDFSLAASPTSLTVNRGSSGTDTIAITRLNAFTGSVAFAATGLPTGVTASFNPTSTTANSSVLTLTASATATTGLATITVTGTSGTLTHTATIALTVAAPATPDFTLAASPASLTVNRGASGTDTITITRTNAFTGSVAFSATGLPTGVTAAFNPTPTTGNSSVLTLTASATATTGPATVTVTGSSGTLTHTATIALTVAVPATPDFSLSASPTSVTVNQGASGTSTVTITRLNSFTGSVAFAATGLPAGVTASFSPTPTTGNSSVLTLAASATATLGAATVTVTGTSGTLTHTVTIGLTVNTGGGNGGVTVTPVVSASSQWFNQEEIQLGSTGTLTALSITITIQRTGGISHSGQYNTVGGTITQSNSSTAAAITYQFTLAAGQTLGAGTGRIFATQQSGTGTVHPTNGDPYTVTYTTGGASFTQSGHF